MAANSKVNRLGTEYIEWLKGLGIVLVVVGHFYSGVFAFAWLDRARAAIYLFHMPLFMAISGFLYARSPRLPVQALVKKKFLRLMLPYGFVSLLVAAAKGMAMLIDFPLRRPVESGDLWAVLLYPHHGFAFFLWFLYTLFVVFCLVRLLEAARLPWWRLFAVALGLRFLPLPQVFCLDLAGANLIYFVFGMGLKRALDTGWLEGRGKEWGMSAGCLAGFLALAWLILVQDVRGTIWPILASLAGILSCWFLAQRVGRTGMSPVGWLGGASSTIYLLHTLNMGAMRYLWEQWIGVDALPAQAMFVASSVLLSLIVPSLVQAFLLLRLPQAWWLFLGLSPRRSGP